MFNTENIELLIDSREGYNVEFKVRVPSKVRELTEKTYAFSNADGGYLLIEVNDNRQIIGTNIVIEVPTGKNKPYIFSGSIFVREGANSQKLRTVEEMRSFFQECNKIFFDAIPCPKFDIYTEADELNIKDFRIESKLNPFISDK